jgi:hypothetical protein
MIAYAVVLPIFQQYQNTTCELTFLLFLCLLGWTLNRWGQEEYKKRPSAKKHRFNLTNGDLKPFALTGYGVFTS